MRAMLLCLALASPAAASWTWGPPIEAPVIGTPLQVTASVDAPAGPLTPEEGQAKGSFEVLAASVGPDKTATLRVMAFALGRQTLPPLRWKAGGTVLESPPLSLTISPPPPQPSDSGDIRDIRGPYKAHMGLWWTLLAALLAAVGYAAWRLTRPAPAPDAGTKADAPPPDRRTPEEKALEALEGLDGKGLAVKEFYDRVSDIVRAYLEERHRVPALQMTSYDLQRALIREGFDPHARQLAKSLFDRCDLAKFARMKPTDQEGRRDLEDAKRLVKLLAPAASEVAGDLAGARPEGGRR